MAAYIIANDMRKSEYIVAPGLLLKNGASAPFYLSLLCQNSDAG